MLRGLGMTEMQERRPPTMDFAFDETLRQLKD